MRKSQSASSDTSLTLSNAYAEIWMNWHSCEISDIRGGRCRDLRPSRNISCTVWSLTLNPLMWRIWWAPNNASRWQMGFNSAFEGLKIGPSVCPKLSIANHQPAPRINNIPEVDEYCSLLGYYAASSGKSLPTFRDRQIGRVFKGEESSTFWILDTY